MNTEYWAIAFLTSMSPVKDIVDYSKNGENIYRYKRDSKKHRDQGFQAL